MPGSAGLELTCIVGFLASGASQVVPVEVNLSTAGQIEITASAETYEAELTPADNVVTHSATYSGPPSGFVPVHNNGGAGGGGGAISWWMLFGLAGALARIRSRREKSLQACDVGRNAADSHRVAC